MSNPSPVVTIVIVPRERFSITRECLESIFEHTRDVPYELVVVDGGSPEPVMGFLAQAARQHDFTLVRTPFFLAPNQAHNLGLEHVRTPYVLFFDNDTVASPGWLAAMLDCAEQTGAEIVTPLTCEGTPLHQVIHFAGGDAGISEHVEGVRVVRRFFERIHRQGSRVEDVRDQLVRAETGVAEFHCMLIRMDLLDRLGRFDEGFLNTKDHIDFCLMARQAGARIFFEPKAIVTFTLDRPLALYDLPYFMLRWSDSWEVRTLRHMMKKWQLDEAGYFANRLRNRGWRRKQLLWQPVARKLSLGHRNRVLGHGLFLLDRGFNWLLSRYLQGRQRRRARRPLEVRLARHQSVVPAQAGANHL